MSAEPIDLTGKATDEAPARKPPRARKLSDDRPRHRPALDQRIRESIEALAAWVRDREDDELADTLERDARAMADVLNRVAKLNPAAKKVVSVIADVLEPVRAFGPTARLLWLRLLARRAEREAELEGEDEYLTVPVELAGEPSAEREVAEPWLLAPE